MEWMAKSMYECGCNITMPEGPSGNWTKPEDFEKPEWWTKPEGITKPQGTRPSKPEGMTRPEEGEEGKPTKPTITGGASRPTGKLL